MRARWFALVAAALIGAPTGVLAQPPAEDGPEAEEAEGAEAAEAPEAPEAEDAQTEPAPSAPTDVEAEEAEEGEGEEPEPTETSLPAFPRTAAGSGAPRPAADPEGGRIPLELDLHGYYRVRAVWNRNVPVARFGAFAPEDHAHRHAGYLFQRLRLEPSVAYGSDPANPVAALYMQFDGLDNVVWGDNARLAATPLFAGDPSLADVEAGDVPSFRLERAWLQFLMPIGQIRVGRMPSQWGLGILTSDGNGLGEWGDPQFGTTYDRLLFATRPLTIVNALTNGDSRPTPLIFVLAYDKLVEDPLGVESDPTPRPTFPLEFLTNGGDDVQEFITALVWNDPDLNPNRATDELTAGLYFVNRWQTHTESDIYIFDAFWNFRYALGPRAPSFYTGGEIVTIQGSSRALPFAGGCDDATGVCNEVDASIWGAVARAGVIDRDETWAATLEGGFSSGDDQYFDDAFTVRPLHPDYHVGLVLYQVALASQTAIALENLTEDPRALWSRGGVWNSWYLWPQARYTLIPGVELHGAFLLAWADQLTPAIYENDDQNIPPDASCGLFEGRCFIGWEADVALRLKWGENDLMWWDTEFGFMGVGDALRANAEGQAPGFTEDTLWSLQTRVAMKF